MNKRIQRKIEKRSEPKTPRANSSFSGPARSAARPARSVVHQRRPARGATVPHTTQLDARKAIEAVRSVAEQVQQRTADTIQHVREKLNETEREVRRKLSKTEHRMLEKISETEERAEALLEKVPLLGGKAAKKLHELTHR
jgi:acyl-CoA reductase-like NAD-dependent aldehyde dehydrogenase